MDSFKSFILDVYFLSKAEFVVCTQSSNVCRLVYELRHINDPFALNKFRSLDDNYFFFGIDEINKI